MKQFSYYIAYGSNMNVEQMEYRCPTATVCGITKLKNHMLSFKGLGSTGFATLEAVEGKSVPVVIWKIRSRDEQNLDRYEGFPTHYHKKFLDVMVGNRKIEAMVYIMNEKAVPTAPSAQYFDVILSGYRSFCFDEYILYEALNYDKNTLEKSTTPLQYYRHIKGMTQKQLAEKTSMPVGRIRKYECGERSIRKAQVDAVLKLADTLSVEPKRLLD